MSSIVMPEKIVRIIDRLEAGEEIEAKLGQVVENELRRRLARYELIDRLFRKKYGMTFGEFEENEMVTKLSYSFEVESDYHDWDIAIDGIKTLSRDLKEIQS